MPFSGGICPKCLKTNGWFQHLLVCAHVAGVKHFPGNSARDRAELVKIPSLGQGQAGQPLSVEMQVQQESFGGHFNKLENGQTAPSCKLDIDTKCSELNKYTHSCGRAVLGAGETDWDNDNPTEPCLESRGITS